MTRVKRLSVYITKVLAGIILGSLAAQISVHLEISWIFISVFLVLSPEGGDALELAVTRIKANLVGACTGFLLVATDLPLVMMIASGSLLALVICELIGLNAGSRAALAALVIVLMDHSTEHLWDSAFHRVISVFIGCLIGLIVTWFIHSVLQIKTSENPEGAGREREA